ncbi:MAG: hypothetical protein QME74_00915, partial [Candidatus Edwardsbacteria bacterium]|nr:hypothetical protein [Candidatus Edwardsbacteria bacterium]
MTAACLAMIVPPVFRAFAPMLGNGFTSWDDPFYAVDNPDIRGRGQSNLSRFFKNAKREHPGKLFPALSIATMDVLLKYPRCFLNHEYRVKDMAAYYLDYLKRADAFPQSIYHSAKHKMVKAFLSLMPRGSLIL